MKALLLILTLLLAGCRSSGYEIHLFADPETQNVHGYVVIDGVRHNMEIKFDDK